MISKLALNYGVYYDDPIHTTPGEVIFNNKQLLDQNIYSKLAEKEKRELATLPAIDTAPGEVVANNKKLLNYANQPKPDLDKIFNQTTGSPKGKLLKYGIGLGVAAGALVLGLNATRGQQTNTQLYGQQPVNNSNYY